MDERFKVGIVSGPIDVEDCHRFLHDIHCGAENLFLGTVRKFTGVNRSGILAEEINAKNLIDPSGQEEPSDEEIVKSSAQNESEIVQTVALEYDCYEPFAKAEMLRLLERAAERWPIRKGLMIHRIGRLELGEASIAVGISTPHRKASFEACDTLVDWAKQSVPIWKREILADGTNQWIHPEFPKEKQLVHARLDLGVLAPGQISGILDKKWKETSTGGILKVIFQNSSQSEAVLKWCQCNNLDGTLSEESTITVGNTKK